MPDKMAEKCAKTPAYIYIDKIPFYLFLSTFLYCGLYSRYLQPSMPIVLQHNEYHSARLQIVRNTFCSIWIDKSYCS